MILLAWTQFVHIMHNMVCIKYNHAHVSRLYTGVPLYIISTAGCYHTAEPVETISEITPCIMQIDRIIPGSIHCIMHILEY